VADKIRPGKMTGDGVPRIAKLDDTNYLQWSTEIEHLMRFKCCWAAVDPARVGTPAGGAAVTRPAPTDEADATSGVHSGSTSGEPTAGELGRLDEQAMSLMVLNVKPHHMPTFRRHPTARGAWAALAQAFRSRGLAWELMELGSDIDDAQLVPALLAGLPSKYELTATVLAMQPGLTVETAQEQLQAAEARLGLDHKADRVGEVANALAATGLDDRRMRRGRERRRCYKCDEIGHIKRDCPSNSRGDKPAEDGGAAGLAMLAHDVDTVPEADPVERDEDAPETLSGAEEAYDIPELLSDSEDDDNVPPLVADSDDEGAGGDGTTFMTVADPADIGEAPAPVWVMDSGASHHMTGTADRLTNVAGRAPVTIMLADGRHRTARTSGTALLQVDSVGGVMDLTLQDVLVVPGLASSLFFVRQAAVRGYEVTFKRGGGVVIWHGDRDMIRGVLSDKVYILPTIAQTGSALVSVATPTAAMWHRRFAHLGATTLERTAKVVKGMVLDKAGLAALRTDPCPPCIQGTMTRAPFPTLGIRTTGPLQVVHTDVAGPMEEATPAGSTFFVGVIDDYTRFKAIVPVKTKGVAKNAVMAVVARWETQTGHRVRVIRSDNGLEYTGGDWPAWLAAKGIQHQTTTRYTPQSNGVAERYNRVVAELTVAALAGCNLDGKFWGEAAVTVNYLGNRVVGRDRPATPYELFYGTRPDVGHLRPFGCRAWIHIPAELRKKLQPRAVAGIFVGYGIDQRGYRVLVGDRVETSRDVWFDEPRALDTVCSTDHASTVPEIATAGPIARFPADLDAVDSRAAPPSVISPAAAPTAALPGPRPPPHTPPSPAAGSVADAVAGSPALGSHARCGRPRFGSRQRLRGGGRRPACGRGNLGLLRLRLLERRGACGE